MKQSNFNKPPVAEIKPTVMEKLGTKRVDNYFWLKDKKDKAVIDYIKKENEYTAEVMKDTAELQKTIYNEIIARIKEDDESCPVLNNGYYYYNRSLKNHQYKVYCRKKDLNSDDEEIIFDCNELAKGKDAFIFNDYSISPDNTKAIYLYNETGSFAEFTMKIKDLTTGKDLALCIDGVTAVAWANDSKTFFYTEIDDTLRPSKVYRSTIDNHNPVSVFEEKDDRFWVEVNDDDKTKQFIFISTASSTTSETWFVSADEPSSELKVFLQREQNIEYDVEVHQDYFFIRYKDKNNLNRLMYKCSISAYDKSNWTVFKPHDESVLIDGFQVIKDYIILELRENGLTKIIAKKITDGTEKAIAFPEPVYTVNCNFQPEYSANTFRYFYTSLNRPGTIYEYDLTTDKTTTLKVQEVPSGFNPDDYIIERQWATSNDGTKVPYAVVYKKELKKDGSNPALLYSYGSYGSSSDVYFSPAFYSLINRGFVFAIAQIRGGNDLGENWYEDGKLLKKKNTFYDFIACSEDMINAGYTNPKKMSIMGGSAGGLLMGAVTNMRPELYHSVIAQVPFVDVVTTMLDESLPLTTSEYEEWGNPNDEEYFKYMLSYSPYDNIEKKDYPHILVTGGINDSQVLFHEPTKYTAKLRANKTDENIVLLHMNMTSGHGGATGRYDSVKDIAFEFAFILKML